MWSQERKDKQPMGQQARGLLVARTEAGKDSVADTLRQWRRLESICAEVGFQTGLEDRRRDHLEREAGTQSPRREEAWQV